VPLDRTRTVTVVINLKAAKALNFEIPPLVRALANEVIE
jgi:hypothetical protein